MVKIKIPQQIKLLTHTYKIYFDAKQLASASSGAITRHLYQDIIFAQKILPLSELNQLFLHEIVHVIERHFCIRLDDADVERISEGLASLLFDNLGIELDWSLISENVDK